MVRWVDESFEGAYRPPESIAMVDRIADRGVHRLKGIDEEWQLLRVERA